MLGATDEKIKETDSKTIVADRDVFGQRVESG